jgi:DNA-binding protein HU-beta
VAVNRSELVQRVAEAAGLDRSTADRACDAFIDAVMADTKAGNKVSLFGFGTFTPTSRAARTGRNPRTGEPVKIAASKSVRFSPASAFKTTLNGKGGAKKAAPSKKSSTKKATGSSKTALAKKTSKKAPSTKKATKSARKR